MKQRMILRRVAPRGLALVSLIGTKPASHETRVRTSRLLLLWVDRAMDVARRLDLDAALEMQDTAKPWRKAHAAYKTKSKRASCVWRGVRSALARLHEMAGEVA